MPEAWRVIKEKHAATAFSGEGAARTGGRWNSRGVAIVYTSGSQSLAVLETLVHLNPPLLFKYVSTRVEFDDALIERVPLNALPPDWRLQPAPASTRQFGDRWVRAARKAILAIPSVVIPEETNYLLNPAHPDFAKIKYSAPTQFTFDPRLLGGRSP